MYQLVTNSVEPQQVRETENAWIIEGVPFIRPMELSGGYVPRANIRETTPLWDGVPVTLQHARNAQGQPIAASRRPDIQLGVAKNPTFDGEHVRAKIRIAKNRLAAVDGADVIREKLEAEEPIDVSSQYAPEPLEPGEYDGEFRTNVEQIVRPDSVALLPNQEGKCSIEHGCGIDPQLVANAEVHVPMTQSANREHGEDMDAAAAFDAGDLVRWETSQGSPGTGRVNRVVTQPGTTVSAEGADVTREATEDEAAYKLDNWSGSEFEIGTVVKSESEIIGAWTDAPDEAMTANQLDFAVTDLSPSDVDAWTDRDWDGQAAVANMPNPSDNADAAATLDQTHALRPTADENRENKANWALPFRRAPAEPVNTRALVAIESALSGRGGGVDDLSSDTASDVSDWVASMLEAAPDDLFGSTDDQEANAIMAIGRQVINAVIGHQDSQQTRGAATGNAPESPADADADPTDTTEPMKDRDDLIDEITSNSAITAESLTDACDERVEQLYEDVVVNSGTDPDGGDDDDDAIEQIANRLDDIESEMVTEDDLEDVVANAEQHSEKEDLAADIVANSDEYDDTEAVLNDYPTKPALEAKADSLDTGAALPGTGATANVETGDDDIEVSAGVFE